MREYDLAGLQYCNKTLVRSAEREKPVCSYGATR